LGSVSWELPRDHLDLLGKSPAPTTGLCRRRRLAEREDAAELALDLHTELAVLVYEPDRMDKRAGGVKGFVARRGIAERLVEWSDLLTITLREIGMQERLLRRWAASSRSRSACHACSVHGSTISAFTGTSSSAMSAVSVRVRCGRFYDAAGRWVRPLTGRGVHKDPGGGRATKEISSARPRQHPCR